MCTWVPLLNLRSEANQARPASGNKQVDRSSHQTRLCLALLHDYQHASSTMDKPAGEPGIWHHPVYLAGVPPCQAPSCQRRMPTGPGLRVPVPGQGGGKVPKPPASGAGWMKRTGNVSQPSQVHDSTAVSVCSLQVHLLCLPGTTNKNQRKRQPLQERDTFGLLDRPNPYRLMLTGPRSQTVDINLHEKVPFFTQRGMNAYFLVSGMYSSQD